MAERYSSIKNFISKYHLATLKDVALFMAITLAIHFAWKIWQNHFEYAPIQVFMYWLMRSMAHEVYHESAWIISGLIDIVKEDESMRMIFPNKAIMFVNMGCSGLKQMMQFGLLMLIFPGPWMKKAWFIPLGIILMHLTNLLRMVLLAVIMNSRPEYWHFSHDYVFRPLFYLVIFLLWAWWVERIKQGKPAA